MPPTPQGNTRNAVALHPQYSDTDIQILHEIVSLASVIPGKQSFRSIWRAYDAVLAARQIDPALDSVYFRFIVRLQGAYGPNLYEKFMVLLDDQGVDVSNTKFLETPAAATASEYTRQRYGDASRRRDRVARAATQTFSSEDYQAGDEGLRSFKSTRKRARQPEVFQRDGIPGQTDGEQSEDSQRHDAVRAAELAAISRREEVRQRREQSSSSLLPPDPTDNGDISEEAPHEPQLLRVPEGAADALYNLRMRTLLRKYFHHWYTMTVQLMVRRSWLDHLGTVHNRKVLLQQAFDIWQEKKWFAVVERRAERRYNLILLTKAWSCWIQKTAAIVQRTHEVRQRILARKYFNSWRAFVLENEEKIRRFQLSNAFWKWRDATARRKQLEADAQRIYETNLAHRAYWSWFFRLCRVLAPKRHNQFLVEQNFYIWAQRTEKIIEMNHMAEAFWRRTTLQVVFNNWFNRTEDCLENREIAEDNAEWSLNRRIFETWRRRTRFAPMLEAFAAFVNDRIMYDHLTIWRVRASQSRTAANMSRRLTLENALRTWKLELRCRGMKERVDQRIKLDVIYNWVLQERLQLLKRVRTRQLIRRAVKHWVERYYNTTENLQLVENRVERLRNRRLAANVLSWWRQRLERQRQLQRDAKNHYEYRVVSRMLHKWKERNDVCRDYIDWAEDALYYFAVKRCLATWKAAFKGSRKIRLRIAYHSVSRERKRNMAISMIQYWRERLDRVRQMSETAENFNNERIDAIAMQKFDIWQERTLDMLEMRETAEQLNTQRLLRRAFICWDDYHQRLKTLNNLAGVEHEIQNVRIVLKFLRRWRTRLWDLDMLVHKGDRLLERNQTLRIRSIFKMWKEKAENKRFFDEQTKIQIVTSKEGGGSDVTEDDWAPLPSFAQSTPANVLRTPAAWGASMRRSIFARTPMGTPPGSPLKRFSTTRKRASGWDLGQSIMRG